MEYDVFKIEVYIPYDNIQDLREELNKIGALTIGGNYDNCMYMSKGMGCFRPLKGADPFKGEVGKLFREEEYKIEFGCKRELVKKAVETINRVHPYEEPVINIVPILTRYDVDYKI
ncbi:cytochrome C biogenesis protein [Clostridium oceanicum]|uniref:Divalent cation tolerance protein CutA n=1 Tax=Clostridium oceanicum TaxID=1543 RepID=A0ABP3UQ28_9CLOT